MTMMPDRAEFDAIARVDFNTFVERVFVELNGSESYLDNFHISLICAELEAVRRGEVRRLAIALPPRSLKSIIVSVAYPAWLLGKNPAAKIICASYGQQLADNLARDCRQVMRSDWYRALYPETRLKSDRQSVGFFETTAGGSRQSTSVGGVLTGFGADIIIVDDPTKPEEAISELGHRKPRQPAVGLFGVHDLGKERAAALPSTRAQEAARVSRPEAGSDRTGPLVRRYQGAR